MRPTRSIGRRPKAVGLYVGAYHFARPDRTPGDAVAEADYFLAMSQLEAGDLVPVLDLEDAGGLSPVELQEWVKGYLGRIYERTGAHGMIYASPTFWKNAMGDTTWFATNGYGMVWVAHWTSGPAPTVPAAELGRQRLDVLAVHLERLRCPGSAAGSTSIGSTASTSRRSLLTSGVIEQGGPTLDVTPSSTVITWGDTVVIKASLRGGRRRPELRPAGGRRTGSPGRRSRRSRPTPRATPRSRTGRRPTSTTVGSSPARPTWPPVTSPTARVVVRQIALLRPTTNGATKVISRGHKVTFTTTVRPSRPELTPAKVTLAIYRRVGGRWSPFTTRSVYVNAAGQASYSWTFSARGEWYVRSIANPTAANANSAWSPVERYTVR